MIVEKTDPKYASDEICGQCDEIFYTDGAYKLHTCPSLNALNTRRKRLKWKNLQIKKQ